MTSRLLARLEAWLVERHARNAVTAAARNHQTPGHSAVTTKGATMGKDLREQGTSETEPISGENYADVILRPLRRPQVGRARYPVGFARWASTPRLAAQIGTSRPYSPRSRPSRPSVTRPTMRRTGCGRDGHE